MAATRWIPTPPPGRVLDCSSLGSWIDSEKMPRFLKPQWKSQLATWSPYRKILYSNKTHSHTPRSWVAQNHHRLDSAQLLTEVDSEDGLSRHSFQHPCKVWVQFKSLLPFTVLLLEWGFQMRPGSANLMCSLPDFDSEWVTLEKRQNLCHLFGWPGS